MRYPASLRPAGANPFPRIAPGALRRLAAGVARPARRAAGLRAGLTTALAAGLAGCVLVAAPAAAQDTYPSHSIELVVPYQAGGGADVMARAFAQAAGPLLPQPFVVVNKPGAAGMIGWNEVIKAPPDGYKVAVTAVEITFLRHLGLTKHSHKELTPVARLNADPAVFVVRADSPYHTLKDLLDAARKDPGNLRVGNAGHGSMWHLASAALADQAGVTFNHIPYTGGAPSLLALMGGHIDAVTVSTPEAAAYVAAGKLRPLVMMAEQRVKGYENTPTAKELGMDLVLGTWRGLAVPVGTPPAVVEKLGKVAEQAMKDPGLLQVMEKQHFTTDTYLDGPAFAASMDRESDYIGKLAARLNLNN